MITTVVGPVGDCIVVMFDWFACFPALAQRPEGDTLVPSCSGSSECSVENRFAGLCSGDCSSLESSDFHTETKL